MDETIFDTPIRTQADLERLWRELMEPLGFGGMSIWLMLIGPDYIAIRQLTQIEDAVEPPDAEQLAGFGAMLDRLRDEMARGGRWAFLRSRPGGGGSTETDRSWARGLHQACRAGAVPTEVVHLATDHDLVPMPMDDLAEAS